MFEHARLTKEPPQNRYVSTFLGVHTNAWTNEEREAFKITEPDYPSTQNSGSPEAFRQRSRESLAVMLFNELVEFDRYPLCFGRELVERIGFH